MFLEKICQFYDHSKCLLSNNFCDLDCSRFSDKKGSKRMTTKNAIQDWGDEEMDGDCNK